MLTAILQFVCAGALHIHIASLAACVRYSNARPPCVAELLRPGDAATSIVALAVAHAARDGAIRRVFATADME